MKKILLSLLCLGICLGLSGCSNNYTKEEAKKQAEEIVDRFNSYEIGKFVLLTTEPSENENGENFFICKVNYTALDDNDIELTLRLIDHKISLIMLEDEDIFTYPAIFNQYLDFYAFVKNDANFYNIKDLDPDKTEAFMNFIDKEIDDIDEKDSGEFKFENGNLIVDFNYIKSTKDYINMYILFQD